MSDESLSIEAYLLRKVLDNDQDLKLLLRLDFDLSLLRFPYDQVMEIIVEHYRKHGEIPSKELFDRKIDRFSSIPIAEKAPNKISAYWEQVTEEALERGLQASLEDISVKYNEEEISSEDMLDYAIHNLQTTAVKYSARGNLRTLGDMAEDVWEDYKSANSGEIMGIPIPDEFRIFSGSLVKLEPGQITTIVGRTRVGKTWLSLILALYAAMRGCTVLIASMEMSARELARRLVALALRADFDNLRKGQLLPDQKALYDKLLRKMRSPKSTNMQFWNNIFMMNPSEIRSVAAIENRAQSIGATMVIADAFYMLPAPQDERWKRVEYNLSEVRRYSLMTQRHWLLTAQFNKKAKGVMSSDEFSVGGSDSFNQDSNNMIFLVRRKLDFKNNQVILILGKGRDCAYQDPWLHRWDFRKMDWSPIGMYQSSGGEGAGGDNYV